MTTLKYPFTEQEMQTAAMDWGCNCGPSALAFVLQKPLDSARYAIRDFDKKRYTSPTMMKQALEELAVQFTPVVRSKVDRDHMFSQWPALVRLQWTGPWTQPGVNPKAAYWHTHWIATWLDGSALEPGAPLVFDCNGGVRHVEDWEENIVPLLLPKRGDKKWHPTHIWRIAHGA